jgi:hypothetical protein
MTWVKGKPFLVYLGLTKWNDDGENVTVLDNKTSRVPISGDRRRKRSRTSWVGAGLGNAALRRKSLGNQRRLGTPPHPIAQLERVGAEIGFEQFISADREFELSKPS